MNNCLTQPVADRQALLYALRTELGLPPSGMGTGSTRFAAIEGPHALTCLDLSGYAIDEGFDMIASVYLSPEARKPRDFAVILRTHHGADFMEAMPIEIAKGKPLVLLLPRSDRHVLVDERGILSRRAGVPVADVAKTKRRAELRLKRSAERIEIPDSISFEHFDVGASPYPSAMIANLH